MKLFVLVSLCVGFCFVCCVTVLRVVRESKDSSYLVNLYYLYFFVVCGYSVALESHENGESEQCCPGRIKLKCLFRDQVTVLVLMLYVCSQYLTCMSTDWKQETSSSLCGRVRYESPLNAQALCCYQECVFVPAVS